MASRRSAALLLSALIAAPTSAQAPLPRLALDTYPTAARQDISRAHRLASARPGDDQAVGSLGRVLQAWEQWDAADQAYRRAQEIAPRTFEWHYLDAVVLQRLAQPAAAVRQLTKGLTASPNNLPARLRLAEALLDAGDLEQSARLFSGLTAPECEPAMQFGLGRIAAARGQHARAIEHLERAVTLFPAFGAAHYALALSYRATGRPLDAQNALKRHAEFGARWPALPDPVLDTVSAVREDAAALLQRGTRLADAGDVDGAIVAHETALVRDPSLARAHANLIALYGRVPNWAKGDEHYRALRALGAADADAEYDYGVLLGLQDQFDSAAEAYRRALGLNPLHALSHNNLGQILERQHAIAAAAAEYRSAVDAQPTLRIARFNLGRMLIAQSHLDDAIAELAKLTEPRDAETPRYLFALAAAHIRAGRRAEAVKWATDARQLALAYGQQDLAASIERDLATIK
ncbi:MAG: tetratricopeptide repeat protein [Vicinamibacterales bacterium]